jgi:hypothetical protein
VLFNLMFYFIRDSNVFKVSVCVSFRLVLFVLFVTCVARNPTVVCCNLYFLNMGARVTYLV